MTFFDSLWAKVKEPLSLLGKARSPAGLDLRDKSSSLLYPGDHAVDEVLQALQETEADLHQTDNVLNNLKRLKAILEAPKEAIPESRFKAIQDHLGIPESYETIRQERWHDKVYCPNCQSNDIKRMAQLPSQSTHNHRYHCLACGLEFNDDSGTPMETGIPPLHIWMQCWYLMGCTDSFSYIAHKLHLDLAIVEVMINQLKEMFRAQKPLSKFLPDETLDKQIKAFKEHFKEDLLKTHERLDANVATTPKDTREFRRQQNLRRTLNTNDTLTPLQPTPGAAKRSR